MGNKTLQNLITTGRFTLPIVILIFICCWGVGGWLSGTPAIQLLPGLALCGLAGNLLVATNNAFALIRVRASAQTALYLLLVSTCPALYHLYSGQAASVCFLLTFFFLFRSYRNENTPVCLFHAFVFAGAGSLLVPKLTLFVPLLWIGAYNFHSLNAKSFIASILGWILPYWFLLCYAYLTDNMSLFYSPFKELADFSPVELLDDISQIITLAYTTILFAAGAIHAIVFGDEDKLSTRNYLLFLALMGIGCIALIGLQPTLYNTILPLLWICVSILGGRLFILTNNRMSNISFIGFIIVTFLLYTYNLWTLL